MMKKRLRFGCKVDYMETSPASTESLLYLIHLILEDADYKYLLDKIELAILPMANIDGFLKK